MAFWVHGPTNENYDIDLSPVILATYNYSTQKCFYIVKLGKSL